MIGLLVLGMLFLLLEQNKLMFASFAYCGLLCLFLKGNVNQGLRLATSTGTATVRVAHFNAASVSGDYNILLEAIQKTQADLVTINELTPDWEYIFKEGLSTTYPSQAVLVRIDPFGLGILSKKPLRSIDTISFYETDHPHLQVSYPLTLTKDLSVITSYFLPPLTRKEYGDYRVELLQMSQEISKISGPILVAGDYNLSDWSAELREFKSNGELSSSRRDVSPRTNTGLKSWMDFPVDHILFNQALECTRFESITDSLGLHMGIVGDYQLSSSQNQRQ